MKMIWMLRENNEITIFENRFTLDKYVYKWMNKDIAYILLDTNRYLTDSHVFIEIECIGILSEKDV